MRGFGGLLTFLVKDADWRKAADIVDAVRIPRIGPQPRRRRVDHRAASLMSYHKYTKETTRSRGYLRQHDPRFLRD